MHMAEDNQTNPVQRHYVFEKFVAVCQSDGVQPGTVHGQRRMVQAHHDMLGVSASNDFRESLQLLRLYVAARVAGNAAIQTDNEPAANFLKRAIRKRWGAANFAHQSPYVVIAGHTMHAHIQRQQQVPETIVSGGRVVLNQVPGNNSALRAPVAGRVVIEDALQRCLCGDATQLTVRISEKMRIREVQDPDLLDT